MLNKLKEFEKKYLSAILGDKKVDKFKAGDTVAVNVKIQEGQTSRIQKFEGLVIAKKSGLISSSFTVRKLSSGVGVERTFAIHAPNIESVVKIKEGKVKRAKLYYIREKIGKAARIAEIKKY